MHRYFIIFEQHVKGDSARSQNNSINQSVDYSASH